MLPLPGADAGREEHNHEGQTATAKGHGEIQEAILLDLLLSPVEYVHLVPLATAGLLSQC